MAALSVGEVSGMIALGVFIVQVLFALALPMIWVAFLSNENNVVTWSVVGRLLHSSHWPTVLRTDTAAAEGVRRRVVVSEWSQTGILALVSIASIVTPFGLYDGIGPAASATAETFGYLRDYSSFGVGTPPRPNAPFTRFCGASGESGFNACPGQPTNQTCNLANTNCTTFFNPLVPTSLIDLFENGTSDIGPTISGLFDIQWRTYQNSTFTGSITPNYRQLSSLILDNKIEAVEGLIVDMVTGGIGFRNHTAPLDPLAYGSTWTEDILFIEPETECVDLNITLDYRFTMEPLAEDPFETFNLTDRGGLSGLSPIQPAFPATPNGQGDLSLRQRAYAAAWHNNYLTLVFYNRTAPGQTNLTSVNITQGATFPISYTLCNGSTSDSCVNAFVLSFDSIQSSQNYLGYLNVSSDPWVDLAIDELNGTTLSSLCAGTTAYSPVNLNSTMVGCTLLYGAPNRTDGGSSLIPDPGSTWSVPVYSCATALKAVIRTVTFQYNGTSHDLGDLKITSTAPKQYPDPSGLPLWGVETLPDTLDFSDAQPLWGILGAANTTLDYSAVDNVTAVAQEGLYLPGFMDLTYIIDGGVQASAGVYQNLPGVDFYSRALYTALTIGSPATASYQGYADYSGMTSLALFVQWQALSASAGNASSIINLVWTDAAANAVVGTKGWGLRAGSDAQEVQVPVTVYHQEILYRLPFAIPAIMVLVAALSAVALVLVLTGLRRTGVARMRALLDATSAGRIIALGLWPAKGAGKKTNEWIAAVGKPKAVRLSRDEIVAEGESESLTEESAQGAHGGWHFVRADGVIEPKLKAVSDEGTSVAPYA